MVTPVQNLPEERSLLIIEDDPIVSHIYRSRLENEGFEVGANLMAALTNKTREGLIIDILANRVPFLRRLLHSEPVEHDGRVSVIRKDGRAISPVRATSSRP